MRGPHAVLVSLLFGGLSVALATSTGCSQTPAPRVQLSPDSAEVLELALLRVRPAYATQRAAIRAGLYRGSVDEPPPARPRAAAPATGEAWVVQIAAYDTSAEARRAAGSVAGRLDDAWEVRIERGPGMFRVALGTWPSSAAAEAALRQIRRHYPDAWIRRAGEAVR